jgi:hypothetical protein
MEMMDATGCKRGIMSSQNLRQEILARWAGMGNTCNAEHADSDTSSDGEFSISALFASQSKLEITESEIRKLLVMESESPRDLSSDEMEECMQRVCGNVMKYPIAGRRWFETSKDRYFAVVFPMSWYCGGSEQLALSSKLQYRVQLQEPSLCYWADEETSATSAPLGSLPIASVVGVSHDTDEDQGFLVKIRTVARCRYSRKSNATVLKVGECVLTLGFPDTTRAKSWASDFQAFIRWVETRKPDQGNIKREW